MVPDAEFRSYYGDPVISAPVWNPREIASYFFLGGLAGASSLVAAGAQLTGSSALARTAKVTSAAAITLSLAALVKDLGRPSRFLNMLRVFKPTSPMNIGSWIVAGYAPLAIGAAASAATGKAVRLGGVATVGAALLGPAVASYTGTLVADSAIPAWHDAYREMPLLFVSSASCAAAGAGLVTGGGDGVGPLARLAIAGTLGDLASSRSLSRRLGAQIAAPYHEGIAGKLMKGSRALSLVGATGALLGATTGRRGVRVLSGCALLASSALTRFGVFYAGLASANDPAATIQPQRARLDRAAEP
jgi:formate-dependent nitrite reductase membrane component NrfD